MKSRWSHLRDEAESLRRTGKSIGSIEATLGIPRSTLSGWFKYIDLSEEQKKSLETNWRNALITARVAAAQKHRDLKAYRIKEIENQVDYDYNNVAIKNPFNVEIALAMLYLGEGFKGVRLGLGNSDPLILRFYVSALEQLCNIGRDVLGAELHLRADQDGEALKKYWSEQLSISFTEFQRNL